MHDDKYVLDDDNMCKIYNFGIFADQALLARQYDLKMIKLTLYSGEKIKSLYVFLQYVSTPMCFITMCEWWEMYES